MKEIALHIMDIAQNSLVAKASLIEIGVKEDIKSDIFELTIRDDGVGMEADLLQRVLDPYTTSRTTRRVGMGLPLLKDACDAAGGALVIDSNPGVGTLVRASFLHAHIDRQPMGDIAGVITLLVTANPNVEFTYSHTYNGSDYRFDSREVKEILEDLPINSPNVGRMIKEMIASNLEELQIG